MQNEIRALVVRNPAVRIVRVLALLKVDHQPLVLWLVLVQLERVDERLVADEVREAALGGRVQFLEEETFNVGRPAFVEPEVGGVGVAECQKPNKNKKGMSAKREAGERLERTSRRCRTRSA
jgi:hypothetical protein